MTHSQNTENKEIMDSDIFLYMMAAHSDDIRIDRTTAEITGDLASAAILTRLTYWFSPSKKDGQKRTKIISDGKDWVAKSDDEWLEECGVTSKQMKRIRPLLISLGLIDIKIKKFNGAPTTHYHLNLETYLKLYKEKIKEKNTLCTKGTNGNAPKGQMEMHQRGKSITEDYKQEIYTEDLNLTGISEKAKKLGDPRFLSLLHICFKSVFVNRWDTVQWLMRLGFKEDVAEKLAKYESYELEAGANYLKKYYLKMLESEKKPKSLPGYFRLIMQKGWYLDKR